MIDREFYRRLEWLVCGDVNGGVRNAVLVTGCSDGILNRWLAGRELPPLVAVAGLCAASGKSLDWLVFGDHAESIARSTRPIRFVRSNVLRARLDVLLSPGAGLNDDDVRAAWAKVEPLEDGCLGDRLLDAAVQALGEDGAWSVAIAAAAAFRDSLTEARDGLL